MGLGHTWSRREKGTQDLKTWSLRNDLKKSGQEGAVKLFPRPLSNGCGSGLLNDGPFDDELLDGVEVDDADDDVTVVEEEGVALAEAENLAVALVDADEEDELEDGVGLSMFKGSSVCRFASTLLACRSTRG